MQLPPALHARLMAGPGTAEPLPVERDPAAGAVPFRFAARLVRFPREHEFFEVRASRERVVVERRGLEPWGGAWAGPPVVSGSVECWGGAKAGAGRSPGGGKL